MDDRAEFRKNAFEKTVLEREKQDGSFSILNSAKGLDSFVNKFLIPFLRAIQNEGWGTGVAAKDDRSSQSGRKEGVDGCETYYDISFGISDLQIPNPCALFSMIQIMKDERYDVVHCHTAVAAAITRMAAFLMRKRRPIIVYTTHGFHFYKGSPIYRWLLFYPAERILSTVTDVLITINKEDYYLARQFKTRVYCLPGIGVDRIKFQPDRFVRRQFREKEEIDEKTFVLLSVCELIPRKNILSVLCAISEMKKRKLLGQFQYWICGSGNQEKQLRKQVKKMKLEAVVRFWGHRDDIADFYKSADLFILLSKQEGLPAAVMEAMATGLPVIASDIRGCSDLIDSDENGLLIDWTSTEQIVSAIQMLYESKEKRVRFSEGGREKMKAYDQRIVIQQVMSIYREMKYKLGIHS